MRQRTIRILRRRSSSVPPLRLVLGIERAGRRGDNRRGILAVPYSIHQEFAFACRIRAQKLLDRLDVTREPDDLQRAVGISVLRIKVQRTSQLLLVETPALHRVISGSGASTKGSPRANELQQAHLTTCDFASRHS